MNLTTTTTTRLEGVPLVPGAACGLYCGSRVPLPEAPDCRLILCLDGMEIPTLRALLPRLSGLLVTKKGLLTHTAIYARELSLPLLLVDGPPNSPWGSMVSFGNPCDPSPLPRQAYTADGILIRFSASVWGLSGLRRALQAGLPIGLLRTEGLFPGERAACRAAVLQASERTTVRLYDFEGDKAVLARGDPELLRELQLQTLSAFPCPLLAVLVPNVRSGRELRRIREQLSRLSGGRVPLLGAMLETREALLNLSELLAQSDFVSIGLNALLRMGLSDDALIAAVKPVLSETLRRGIPVNLCGEPPLRLLGPLVYAGIRSFCCAPSALPQLAQSLSALSLWRLQPI